TGNVLNEFSMNSSTDTIELLGGFEQVDPSFKISRIVNILKQELEQITKKKILNHELNQKILDLHNDWYLYSQFVEKNHSTVNFELKKLQLVKEIAKKTLSPNHSI